MDGISLIQDLAIVLLAAAVAGAICRRLSLSVVVGYLVAGIIIGPHTPPFSFVLDTYRIQTLSQVGLVFLMFGIGLGLSIRKLGKLGWQTLVATGLGAVLMLVLTQALGKLAGWTAEQSLFVAAMFMVSSSAVISKIADELHLAHERSGQLALAVTVLEDVVAVVMLTILGARSVGGSGDVGSLLAGLTAFVVLLVGGGLLMIPRLMRRLEARADSEIQTITVAGLLFLLALAAVKAGYSLALGAFLLGTIVAEIPQKAAVEKSFAGMRDLFSSVFFVAIGMLIDVKLLLHAWPLALGLAAFVLAARPIALGLALTVCGTRPAEARRAGLLLTPLGEFSFILAQLGVGTGVLPERFYPAVVGVSIFTVLAVPPINRHADTILRWSERIEPGWVRRAGEAYHAWISEIGTTAAPSLAWKLIRARLVQIGIEMLFITGVMIFSPRLFELVAANAYAFGLSKMAVGYLFWAGVTLIVLIPLVAVWRNVSTAAMIVAESLGGGTRGPAAAVRGGIKGAAAAVLAYWLYVIWPSEEFGGAGWAVIALAVIVVAVFSSRLIYWHSQWQASVRDVLSEETGPAAPGRLGAKRERNLQAWNARLGECVVPPGASYAGKSLEAIAIPARFGCALLEVERNGIVITAIRPGLRLYPGDKLLLMGEAAQIEAACVELSREEVLRDQSEEFRRSVLEEMVLPEGPWSGRTLADLKLATVTGVRVVGIQRGRRRIIAPSGSETLQAGDNTLIAGTLGEIAEFRRWLAAGGRDAEASS